MRASGKVSGAELGSVKVNTRCRSEAWRSIILVGAQADTEVNLKLHLLYFPYPELESCARGSLLQLSKAVYLA